MEDTEIASLVVGAAAIPLNIRVLRKWKPTGRPNETCYLFVDKQGIAIQAAVTNSEQRYVENSLSLGSCYNVENYGCARVDPFTNVVTHCTHLSIGISSTFKPIPDTNEIPRQYFDFASRNRMLSVCDKEYQVIDYIGYVQKIEHFETREKRPFVVISIRDCSNKDIKLTLWEEICTKLDRYNRLTIESAPDPRVVAATSIKVKNFQGQIKLQSTTATYVYLNPLSLHTQVLLDQYHNGQNAILAPDDDIVEETTITLREMLVKPSDQINGYPFNVVGHITYIPTQEWCHVACQNCNKEALPSGTKWFCSRHGLNDTPRYIYRVNCVIKDLSGTINATIYDEGISALIGQTCRMVVENNEHRNMSSNPTFMDKVILKESKFRIVPTKNSRTGVTRCTCDRVEPLQPPAAIDANIDNNNDHNTVEHVQPLQSPPAIDANINIIYALGTTETETEGTQNSTDATMITINKGKGKELEVITVSQTPTEVMQETPTKTDNNAATQPPNQAKKATVEMEVQPERHTTTKEETTMKAESKNTTAPKLLAGTTTQMLPPNAPVTPQKQPVVSKRSTPNAAAAHITSKESDIPAKKLKKQELTKNA